MLANHCCLPDAAFAEETRMKLPLKGSPVDRRHFLPVSRGSLRA
jgi:hypothetical protein